MISWEEYKAQVGAYDMGHAVSKLCMLCSEDHNNKYLCTPCWIRFDYALRFYTPEEQIVRMIYDKALEKYADKEFHKLLSSEGE